MALNVDKLREGLRDYGTSLNGHTTDLRSRFSELQQIYLRLATAYEGNAAEALKTSWSATAQWFETYIDETHNLHDFLEERLASLEKERG